MTEDPRPAAARYRLEKQTGTGRDGPEGSADEAPGAAGQTEAQRTAMVEIMIQQAIRRGEFDNLPGAGKPLTGLGRPHDPDWWIKQKIEHEKLRGLGPPALTLRVENTELDDRLDRLSREEDVRETLEDFNRRVVEARRQLLGGPPVVTPTRDVAAEVTAWRERRAQRLAADRRDRELKAQRESRERPRRRWRRRA